MDDGCTGAVVALAGQPNGENRMDGMTWMGMVLPLYLRCAAEWLAMHVHRYWNPECNKMMIRQRLSECRLLDAHH